MQEQERETLNFEQAMNKLEEIVKSLESNELSLEDSLKIYEEGTRLSKFCMKCLDEAEKKIMELKENEKGEPYLSEWDGER